MVSQNSTFFDLIVFDLDDTLLDTSGELLQIADTPAFFSRIQRPLPLIAGALDNLQYLSKKYQMILLTQGDPSIQNLKIANLPIQKFFSSILIANKANGETKEHYFKKIIAEKAAISPHRALSIGNRISTDLFPAKKLGFKTCHFHYGEHLEETTHYPPSTVDFQVFSHQELISECSL